DRDARAHASRPPRAPPPGLRGGRARARDPRIDARAARRSPFHAARRRLVVAIDRRRGGCQGDVGGAVVWPGGTPRLPVPDLPVGLAPPRVGGVPLATLPRAPAAPAHAPRSRGGPRIPPGLAEPLRDPVHALLGGGRRHVRRAHDVRGHASASTDHPPDHAGRRKPRALPRAAVLL